MPCVKYLKPVSAEYTHWIFSILIHGDCRTAYGILKGVNFCTDLVVSGPNKMNLYQKTGRVSGTSNILWPDKFLEITASSARTLQSSLTWKFSHVLFMRERLQWRIVVFDGFMFKILLAGRASVVGEVAELRSALMCSDILVNDRYIS